MKPSAARERKPAGISDRLAIMREELRSMLNEVAGARPPIPIDPHKGLDFYEAVRMFESDLISAALDLCDGNQRRAASLLNLSPSTLCMKIKHLNVCKGIRR